MSSSPSTEPVLCDEFMPVSAQCRDEHRPVLLLSPLPAENFISGIQTHVGFVLLEVVNKKSSPAMLFFYSSVLFICL